MQRAYRRFPLCVGGLLLVAPALPLLAQAAPDIDIQKLMETHNRFAQVKEWNGKFTIGN